MGWPLEAKGFVRLRVQGVSAFEPRGWCLAIQLESGQNLKSTTHFRVQKFER